MSERKLAKKNPVVVETGSPTGLIKQAVESGADLEKLGKLLELQERWDATQAKKAYNQAMAEFKANPPKIGKDKTVSYGNTKYNHASLANVTDKVNTELSKYGLSAFWTTNQNGKILVTCRITHVQGHSENTTLSASADTSGSKNPIQAIGSAITYLQRYTLLALTGLATFDQDDDGLKSESEQKPEQKPEQFKKPAEVIEPGSQPQTEEEIGEELEGIDFGDDPAIKVAKHNELVEEIYAVGNKKGYLPGTVRESIEKKYQKDINMVTTEELEKYLAALKDAKPKAK